MAGQVKFYRYSSLGQAADKLAEKLLDKLKRGGSALWLVSGGSSLDLAVKAAELMAGSDLSRLSVGQIDERYGPLGHPDSNWSQLIAKGFRLDSVHLRPILAGAAAAAETAVYNDFIAGAADKYDYRLGLLGLGADGHTAGILPHSPALNSTDYVTYYQGPDYQRITLTPKGLAVLDEAVVFVQGQAKRQALDNLKRELTITEQPAQALKQIKRLSVYNDLEGEKL